jgi:hypothetical protein
MEASHLRSSAVLAHALMRHSHLMVNDQLRELCFSLSSIGTPRLAALISRYPAATVCEIIPRSCLDLAWIIPDHSTFMKICGAFALKREPPLQSSLLWWRPEKRP